MTNHQDSACLGIILAGGKGTRMAPMTVSVSKQLLPVYDKPTIFYPLTTLIEAGIRRVLVISQQRNLPLYRDLLQAGRPFGMDIRLANQDEPQGIAEAFLIADDALRRDRRVAAAPKHILPDCRRVCLILGDNIFHGDVGAALAVAMQESDQANIFLSSVKDPQRYGVAELSEGHGFDRRVLSIEEKPANPKSSWAVTGLYTYPSDVLGVARGLQPSARGELEITDVNKAYLARDKLRPVLLGPGEAWLDSGTPEALLEASQYVRSIQERQGRMVGCPEEAAFRNGWISREALRRWSEQYPNSYGEYLRHLAGL